MKYNAVKTNSMSELIEAIDLFKELGYKRPDWLKDRKELAECVFIDKDYEIITGRIIGKKEITLPELRDMVVLKRNDRKDSNVSEENCLYDLYLTESEDLYFYHCGKNEWILSNLNGDEDYCKSLKPIEEKEMKEFLVKNKHDEYVLLNNVSCIPSEFVIEVPEGADVALSGGRGSFYFYKNNDSYFNGLEWRKCDVDSIKTVSAYVDTGAMILWQRHNQPEELPFIGGEPKPDTPMAYMEREFERDQCMENARREGLLGDPRIGAPHNPCYEPRIDTYKSEFGVEPPISLNSQYAEIEKARQATKETEYLMQGKNGEKLMESLAQFHNTDRGADFDNFELLEDSVNHPSHYTVHPSGIECIEIARHHDFAIGNAIKYLWRAGLKNSDNEVQDLEKAVWYIQDKIKQLKKLNENSSKD